MTITKTMSENTKRFEDINCGDVFEYNGDYYMKIYIPQNMNNAVHLDNGEALFFHDSKYVTLVDHELIIK